MIGAMIPVSQPYLTKSAKEYVQQCMETNWISSRGSFIQDFQNKFCKLFNFPYALCVSNGTVALELALKALGIKTGDEVLVPNFTFAATINAVINIGATPVLIDSDLETLNMSMDALQNSITDKTRAIILVHVFGNPMNVAAIRELIPREILIIEDSAEALGAKVNNEYIGKYSDASTFSFFANKIISTGEGGMITFNSEKYFNKARTIMNHGMDSSMGDYYHTEIGTNYRMTNLQAAIGFSQLESFDFLLGERFKIYDCYDKNLEDLNIYCHAVATNATKSPWLYTVIFEDSETRNRVKANLKSNLIQTKTFFTPLSEMKIYSNYKSTLRNDHELAILANRGLILPTYVGLQKEDIFKITQIIRQVLTGETQDEKIQPGT